MPGKTRILCVDDDPATNRLHALLLGTEPDMEVIGAVTRWAEVLPAIQQLGPDVVLLDLSLGPQWSPALLGEIVQSHPDVRVIVLSGFDQPEVVEGLFASGACGFITKAVQAEVIAETIREVVRGGKPRVGAPFR